LVPVHDAEYSEIIEVNLDEVTEPLLACPNDPDDVRPLSEVQVRPRLPLGTYLSNNQ
jgi:aconitate hydratase 2/2-methylisocitrate dehydratase